MLGNRKEWGLVPESQIPFQNKLKNLGLVIRSDLKWLDHAELIHHRVFAGLRSLWPFADVTPMSTRKMLAKTLLMPHFEYCSTVFSYSLGFGDRMLLRSAFNAVLRYVYGLSWREDVESYAVRFVGYSLQNFFKFTAMSFLFKLILTKSPRYLSDLINIDYSTRRKQADIPMCSTMLRNTIFGMGLADWNLLSVQTRFSNSYESFKNRYLQQHGI